MAPRKKATEQIDTQPVPTVEVVVSETAEMDEFANAIVSIETEIETQFPEALVKVLKKIATEVAVIGLTESEACLISDYPHEKFIELKQKYPLISRLMEVKDLEYKRKLLKSISAKAGTDDKVAQWLLEAKYPSEFNRRKGAGRGGDDDAENLVGAALEFVRKRGDNGSLISEESGRAFVFKTKGGVGAVKSIEQVLG